MFSILVDIGCKELEVRKGRAEIKDKNEIGFIRIRLEL